MQESALCIGNLTDIADQDVSRFNVHGVDIAVYRVGDEVFATSNICTHGKAFLSDGYFENFEIECPLHQGRFDIRSGAALCKPLTEDLATYRVEIVDGQVYLEFPRSSN
ncbi:non-heme iron oxygenase ferredoxin subunit [Paraburkholderia xenovorans]